MGTSHEHPACQRPSCKAPLGEQEDEEERGRGGRTASKSGQAWTSQRHKGRQATERSGDSWFQGHRWCPNDTMGYGIDDDDEEEEDEDDERVQHYMYARGSCDNIELKLSICDIHM